MKREPAAPPEVLAQIRAPLAASGATATDAPILQPLSLLLDLAGEAMRARLFVVQAEGGQEACLRPDFTVAIARQHIDAGGGAGRYLYEGHAFRASPEADRPDEFLQLGVEFFAAEGAPQVEADCEVASLAWRASAAGGRDDLTLWLGDVGLLAPFIDSLGLPPALAARIARVAGRPRLLNAELARVRQAVPAAESQLAAMLSGLGRREAAAMLEEVWSLAGVEPVGGRGPAEIAARIVRKAEAAAAPALTEAQADALRAFLAISASPSEALARIRQAAGPARGGLDAALEAWERRLATLDVPVERLRFAPALGHAFDYYDGLTFEVRSEALGPERSIAVGGRYDALMARLGGEPGCAVGCMVRPWRAFAGGES